MFNLLAEWLKKNVTVLFSIISFTFLVSVIVPLIVSQVNIVTVNLPCEYVPNLVQQYTPFPPPWKCDKPKTAKADEKIITIDIGVIVEEKAHSLLPESKENVKKRNFVKSMFLEYWQIFEEYGLGYPEGTPVINDIINELEGKVLLRQIQTEYIVSSMSTIWVMDLKEQFERGKNWIKKELDLRQDTLEVPIWNIVVDKIGGLLSCYGLTGDRMFVEKANEIAQILQPAYASRTGLPYSDINLNNTKTRTSQNYLSSIGTSLLEYTYLFNLTNDRTIEKRVESFWKFVREVEKPKGLYMPKLDVDSGKWTVNKSSLMSDGLYLNLIKSYIQSGEKNMEALKLYSEATEAIERNGMIRVTENNQYFVNEYDVEKDELVWHGNAMTYSACNLGATYSLGANAIQTSLIITEKSQVDRHMQLARELTETCHQASVNTKTGLTPNWFDLAGQINENIINEMLIDFGEYALWPHLAETYFILWRLTHEQKYRDYAWQMVMAIHRHCRIESGNYFRIKDVNQVPTVKTNGQPPHLLSATLKYLYLTFTPDSVLPLDQWVFNSMGHPLPICGANDAYPKC